MKKDLQFPVFDDRALPPPHLTFAQLTDRMVERWASLTTSQRTERLHRDDKRRIPVRFTLTDDHQDQAKS